jgi:hypothetical protein
MTTSALLLALSLLQADPAVDAAKPAPAAELAATPAPAATVGEAPKDAGASAGDVKGAKPAEPPAAASAPAPSAEPPAATAPPEQPVAPKPIAEPAPAAAPAAEPSPAAPLPAIAAPAPAAAAPAPVEPAAAAAIAAPVAAYEAAEKAPEGGCPAAAECECDKPKKKTRFGLSIDAGWPDFAGVSILWRPWYWLRLEAGGTTTWYASNGVRAGVSLVPFYFPITPAVTVNYGRVLESDWNPMLAKFNASNADLEPVLRQFGYDYVDAHVGLEMGSARRFTFFVRGGLTQFWSKVHGLTPAAMSQLTGSGTDATVKDATVTIRMPSVKLGFLIYFF